jgi:Holliday junction DNA helicase RuvA
MISIVRGTLVAKTGDVVCVLTPGGVGYELSVPVSVLEQLPNVGHDVQLHTVLVVREDAWSLFGFSRTSDRSVFERLLQASGVGPRLALALVSALGTDRLVRALQQEDLAILCTVPGVGKKKAERMVLELRDRIRDLETSVDSAVESPATEQAIGALVNLGYNPADADTAVRAVLAANAEAETGTLLREALQYLTTSK